jgi:hypothetical protein
VKLLTTFRKGFKKFQEIVKKVYGDMTLKRNADISNFQKAKEGKMATAAVDQRHLNKKASIADITNEVENDRQENVS